MSRFRRALVEHFELEEHDGFMNSVMEQVPEWAPQVEHLLLEHQEMKHKIENIERQASGMLEWQPDRRLEFSRSLENILNQLMLHEKQETTLIQRALYRDTGAQD